MPRRKAKKIFEALTLPNLFDPVRKESHIKWSQIFGNDNNLILELGCGTGQYTLALAELYPNKNIIGIDLKPARMLRGATLAIQKKLTNVAFLYLNINKLLDHITPGSAEHIWITFPDPYPRAKHAKHRLTSPFYMKIYRKILAPHGTIQLKTDDFALFSYTLDTIIQENCQILRQVNNVYADTPNDSILTIQTTFEKKHLANQKNIYYVQWCF